MDYIQSEVWTYQHSFYPWKNFIDTGNPLDLSMEDRKCLTKFYVKQKF